MVITILGQVRGGIALTSFDAVFYAITFLVPGFIMDLTLSIFAPRRQEDLQISILRFLTLSCVNYAVWCWLIYLIFFTTYREVLSGFYTAVFLGVFVFISPLAIGVLLGFFSQKEWIKKILNRLGLNTISSTTTSWDYRFSKLFNESVWLKVILKDGTTVAGYSGNNSFASSISSERDLYIEEMYTIDTNKSWERLIPPRGILLKAEEIKYIEFWNDKQEEANV
jgi:hypothetical protein